MSNRCPRSEGRGREEQTEHSEKRGERGKTGVLVRQFRVSSFTPCQHMYHVFIMLHYGFWLVGEIAATWCCGRHTAWLPWRCLPWSAGNADVDTHRSSRQSPHMAHGGHICALGGGRQVGKGLPLTLTSADVLRGGRRQVGRGLPLTLTSA